MSTKRLFCLISYVAGVILVYTVIVHVFLVSLKLRYQIYISKGTANKTEAYLTVVGVLKICPHPVPQQANEIEMNVTEVSLKELDGLFPSVDPGGVGRPKHCTAVSKVAIIVAFRDREQHLGIFLRHFHPFLLRQLLDYRVFIIQMIHEGHFNKGSLFNVGFLEIEKRFPGYFDCLVLQDVDVLPEDNRISYACNCRPTHLASHIDKWAYKLFYRNLIGGAFQINFRDYRRLNGFSNQYLGWGGEDDDFQVRLDMSGMNFTRYPEWSRWTTLKHKQAPWILKRTEKLITSAAERMNEDGLNDINYQVISYKEEQLYTNITVILNTKMREPGNYVENLSKSRRTMVKIE